VQRAYFDATVERFVASDPIRVLGALAETHGFALDPQQRNAWVFQVHHLQKALDGLDGHLFLEFAIPRMGKRADVILLHAGLVFVLEYKVGAETFSSAARVQALDYALDLKNFHAGTHDLPVVPIVVATEAPDELAEPKWGRDQVAEPACGNEKTLRPLIEAYTSVSHAPIDHTAWARAPYKPTPTIVEAARALYSGHSVEEISRSDAGAINLSRTASTIARRIERAKAGNEKTIIFVTGVPGSGKTLAGLNLATERMRRHEEEHAVFLSGNGPLVTVLREALARDDVSRARDEGRPQTKKAASQKASAFIQNIHHFRDDALTTSEPPTERVVVFDEAQRAWTQKQASQFMKTKRGQTDFSMSEPQFLLSVMNRHVDWCVVVCLIGGGQEINTGEAGLGEWFRALAKYYPNWTVAVSGELTGSEYAWDDLENPLSVVQPETDPDLHLGVSIRSFRAEAMSAFVAAVIEGDRERARSHLQSLQHYPLVLTRDLDVARHWLRLQARGSERIGLVASSNALRLKPEGIHVKSKIDAVNWFLNDSSDVRSSFALEDAASEFDIQGLELDWVGVCWDANFRYEDRRWGLYRFSGTSWQSVHEAYARIYLVNAYRVLLTRARQGMAIFVPRGDAQDETRPPSFYDGTIDFLMQCGIPLLEGDSR
jgi:hypothetical protein